MKIIKYTTWINIILIVITFSISDFDVLMWVLTGLFSYFNYKWFKSHGGFKKFAKISGCDYIAKKLNIDLYNE